MDRRQNLKRYKPEVFVGIARTSNDTS